MLCVANQDSFAGSKIFQENGFVTNRNYRYIFFYQDTVFKHIPVTHATKSVFILNCKVFCTTTLVFWQEKHVNTVAVGIGPNIDSGTLELIAGDGPVVEVENFNKLEEMMATIKSSACSGTSKIKRTLNVFCRCWDLISDCELTENHKSM